MARPALQALLAVCLVTAGCSTFGADRAREERAVTALDDATNATAEIQTYRFESDIDVTATADGRTERVDVHLTGAVDAAAREMRSNATSDGQSRRTFVQNRTVYRECASPWDGWGVVQRDADDEWVEQTPAARQLSLLESGSLYWNGTRTVDGQRVAVVTSEPSTDALTEYSEDRPTWTVGGPSVEDPRLRVRFDADTGRLLWTEFTFRVSNGDSTATATMTTAFSGYGDPVSVDVPDEARTDTYELGCPGE